MSTSKVCHFEERSRLAALYFEALSGRSVSFHLFDDLTGPVPADTDSTVRLPSSIDWYDSWEANWGWYKVALSYRALRYHPVRGTFIDFGDDESGLDGRDRIAQLIHGFASPSVGRLLFDLVEGARLDVFLIEHLPGLRAAHAAAQADARGTLADDLRRSQPRSQLLMSVLLSSLIRSDVDVQVSRPVAEALPATLAAVAHAAGGSLTETLAATRALYHITAGLPPMNPSPSPMSVRIPALASVAPVAPRMEAGGESRRGALPGLEGSDKYAMALPIPLYRGVLGTRDLHHADTGRFRAAALLALRDDAGGHDHSHVVPSDREDDGDEDAGPPEPQEHEHGDIPKWETPYVPPVSVGSGNVTWYPEWDFVAQSYRASYCRVVDEAVAVGRNSGFVRHVIEVHRRTLARLIRQWAQLPREGLAVQRGLAEGDEVHLDSAIQFRIDKRAGAPTSDRIYQRKIPIERDVAVGVLVDLSMSTAERVEDGDDAKPFVIDQEAMRLYNKPYRTTLDHSREAAIVLAELMDQLGDQSLIYGFSSTRRQMVRMLRIKEHDETTHGSAASRFEVLKPIDATRMGAVIRHGTTRVKALEARSRFLVVVTDGLPFDVDYGDDYPGREMDYALHDTARALDEAEAAGVHSRLVVAGAEGFADNATSILGDRVDFVAGLTELPDALSRLYMRMRTKHEAGVRALSA